MLGFASTLGGNWKKVELKTHKRKVIRTDASGCNAAFALSEWGV